MRADASFARKSINTISYAWPLCNRRFREKLYACRSGYAATGGPVTESDKVT